MNLYIIESKGSSIYTLPSGDSALRSLSLKHGGVARFVVELSPEEGLNAITSLRFGMRRLSGVNRKPVLIVEGQTTAKNTYAMDVHLNNTELDADFTEALAKGKTVLNYEAEFEWHRYDADGSVCRSSSAIVPITLTHAIIQSGNPSTPELAQYPPPTDLVTAGKIGIANGVAPLGRDGRVPATMLPSYVDDVEEFPSRILFPAAGEYGKLYVETFTNKLYRWSGSSYVSITSAPLTVINALNSTSTTDALSAAMGKQLGDKLATIPTGGWNGGIVHGSASFYGDLTTENSVMVNGMGVDFKAFGGGQRMGIVNKRGVLGYMPTPSGLNSGFEGFMPFGPGPGGESSSTGGDVREYRVYEFDGLTLEPGRYRISMNYSYYTKSGTQGIGLPEKSSEIKTTAMRPFSLGDENNPPVGYKILRSTMRQVSFPWWGSNENNAFQPLVAENMEMGYRMVVNPYDIYKNLPEPVLSKFTACCYISIDFIIQVDTSMTLVNPDWTLISMQSSTVSACLYVEQLS